LGKDNNCDELLASVQSAAQVPPAKVTVRKSKSK
jgi:hypothetical protein